MASDFLVSDPEEQDERSVLDWCPGDSADSEVLERTGRVKESRPPTR